MSIFERVLKFLREKERLRVYLQTFPTVLWLALFVFIPLGLIIVFSFWDMVRSELIPVWDLHNYVKFFTKSMYINLFFKTVGMAALITLGSIALAYPVAYYISMHVEEKYKYVWLIVFLTPSLISWVIRVFGWRLVIGYSGLVNWSFQTLGLISEPMEWMMRNWWTVVFVLIMGWAPWLVLPIFVSLEKIEKNLVDAAKDLGASSWKAFQKITFPLSIPGLLVATLFVLIPTFGEFVTPVLLGGRAGLMFGNLIQYAFARYPAWPWGSALSVFLIITSLISAWVLIKRVGLRELMESL